MTSEWLTAPACQEVNEDAGWRPLSASGSFSCACANLMASLWLLGCAQLYLYHLTCTSCFFFLFSRVCFHCRHAAPWRTITEVAWRELCASPKGQQVDWHCGQNLSSLSSVSALEEEDVSSRDCSSDEDWADEYSILGFLSAEIQTFVTRLQQNHFWLCTFVYNSDLVSKQTKRSNKFWKNNMSKRLAIII